MRWRASLESKPTDAGCYRFDKHSAETAAPGSVGVSPAASGVSPDALRSDELAARRLSAVAAQAGREPHARGARSPILQVLHILCSADDEKLWRNALHPLYCGAYWEIQLHEE